MGLLGHAHALEELHRAGLGLLTAHAQDLARPQRGVVGDRHLCEEVGLLKDHAALGAHPGELAALQSPCEWMIVTPVFLAT
ncbi:hypothetical protein H9X80_00585 [Olsenella profusa]|uniref:Uncharacterized protein n=1 Tax=Olsenella profusa TaxID=138595 RepID=A0ABS2EZB2_9ACTN|nr:hypothetical protein [Olsenella profusa]MBM6774056.1 hypothetical protein [Olsenella profusa]